MSKNKKQPIANPEIKAEFEARRMPIIDTSKETWAEFRAWWTAQCAAHDETPKHIPRNHIWKTPKVSKTNRGLSKKPN